MKVPIYEPSVQQQGFQEVQQTPNVNAVSFINPTAQTALNAAGGALEDIGKAAYRIDRRNEEAYQQQLKEANATRAMAAYNQYQQYTQDQLYSQDGLLTLRGEDAFKPINGKSPLDAAMDDRQHKRDALMLELGNDEQRQAFAPQADNLDLHVRGQLMGHEAEQHRTYQSSVYQAGLETSARDAIFNYNDPDASQKAFDAIQMHSVALAKLHGQSEEFGISQSVKLKSEVIKGQIDAALQHGNQPTATVIYKHFGEQLDPNDRLNIENKIGDNWAAKMAQDNPQALIQILTPASKSHKPLSAQELAKLAPYEADINEHAQAHGVNPDFMRAQIMVESSGNPDARSKTATSTGQPSIGLAQFQPATAKRYGIDPTDPKQAIKGQAMYMGDLLKMFDGDYSKAAAGYNWGEGNVQKAVTKYGADWLQHAPNETRNYVAKLTEGSEQQAGQQTGTPADMMNAQDRVKWLNAAQNKLEHGQAVFRAGLENDLTNQFAQIASTGQTGNLKSLAEFQQAYGDKAPLAYADYQDQVDYNRQYFGIKDMPIAKAQALLAESRPKAGEDSPDFAREQKQYNALASAFSSANEARQQDPMTYAYHAGFPIEPINWQNPGQAADQISKRMAVSDHLSTTYGTEPLILTKQEQKELGSTFDGMAIDDALKLMDTLKKGSNQQSYNAAMQQLRKDSPVTALAGSLYGIDNRYVEKTWYGGSTPIQFNGQKAAEYVLKGERLLNPTKGDKEQNGRSNTLFMPKETDLKAAFDSRTNGAFAGKPETANTTYQAVRAAYAGLTADAGDTSEQFNADTFTRAMELVTGSNDGALDVFNNKIIPPYGMPENVFVDKVQAEFNRQIQINKLPILPSYINSYKIIPIDDGVYGFTDGNTVQPIVVNLNDNSHQALVDQINP